MTAPEKVDPAQNPSGAKSFLTDESGATAAEYALILGFVALAIFAGVNSLGQAEGNKLGNFATTLAGS